jgi:hypothetical protein
MLFDFVLCAARHLLHSYDLGSKSDENGVSLISISIFTHKINVGDT